MPPPSLCERVPAIPPEIEQVVLRALAKDPKARFASVAAFSAALEQASQRALAPTAQLASEQPVLSPTAATSYETVAAAPSQPVLPTETTPSADLPVGALEPTVYPGSSTPYGLDTPQSKVASETPQSGQLLAPTVAVVSPPLEPVVAPVQRKARRVERMSAALLIGLAVLVVAGGVLGSLSVLAHFGVIATRSGLSTLTPVRGGTWTDEITGEDFSFLPTGSNGDPIDMALYLPLFYGDAQGVFHPGAAREIPTVQNGGISADATTWTFHLRPGLVWSDGQPYDARDVDFTWRLWLNPKFGASTTQGYDQIKSADVSSDNLSITFHLRQGYAPFLSLWVDGFAAPLPAHHFSSLVPEAILKERLNPKVTSGPFLLSEYVPGDHVTLVRNPHYYRAREGLPYLDKVVIRFADVNPILQDLQAGTITSAWPVDLDKVQAYQRLSSYTLVTPPTNAQFEGLFFNFHNVVLANHPEVRQAMAMAIDHPALIQMGRHGFATPLCTDHGSFYHPGYEVATPCPVFDPAAANKLLDDNGWVKGADGVRTRGGQRLEFEYSTNVTVWTWRMDIEAIIQRNFRTIGIQLDIQNYSIDQLFDHLLPDGKASPPSGAVAGRYDIAEYANGPGYDPDDSFTLSCDQIPPKGMGSNMDFYCNPALDALYKQELATIDSGVRQQLFSQIHGIYLTDLPFITLYSVTDPSIVRKGTHNFRPSPLIGVGEWVNIWEWWCDGGKC
jgi:peptide/nickel transport system substrate-binding protein